MYLTESSLGIALTQIFPDKTFVKNKQVPNSGLKCRPDYRCDELKLIVEFDGYQHFNSHKVQEMDEIKDMAYGDMGYRIVGIPYFVQLSSLMIFHWFGVKLDYTQTYSHGFVSDVCLRPRDFNVLGLLMFNAILGTLPKSIVDDIMFTLTETDYKALAVIK